MCHSVMLNHLEVLARCNDGVGRSLQTLRRALEDVAHLTLNLQETPAFPIKNRSVEWVKKCFAVETRIGDLNSNCSVSYREAGI